MAQAQSGDTVKVHYTGKLDDGRVFDTSRDTEPLEFTIGRNQVIPGFEEAVIGMSVGETKTARIAAGNAYGTRHEEWVVDVGRDELPDGADPVVGQHLQVEQEDGQRTIVRVSATSEDSVTLDANHPLAGEDLTFEIELLQVQ